MRIIRQSNLDEFADQFWKRQQTKHDPKDKEALADIEKNGGQLKWLVNLYPYKLPHPNTNCVHVVEIETKDEINSLLIHDYLPCDKW